LSQVKKPWNFEGASCWGIDTDYFFPENKTFSNENRIAKQICQSCVVKKDCLEYALHYSVLGIWGGTSTRERIKLRTELNIIAKPLLRDRATE
jgi:WhiB family redox-sensing transcriptional regulator